MDYYDEWAESCLPESLSDKLYGRGYHWFGCFRGVKAEKLLDFMSRDELALLRDEWPTKDSLTYPFLCDGIPYLGDGI